MKFKHIVPFFLIPVAFVIGWQPKSTAVPNSQLRSPGGSSTLAQVVTLVVSGTPNSFPLPAGKTSCIVTRNIAQSPGIDYTISSGAVVFTRPSEIDDVVQLNCF